MVSLLNKATEKATEAITLNLGITDEFFIF